MKTNVIRLSPPAAPAGVEPDDEAIQLLEEVLQLARAGKVGELLLVADCGQDGGALSLWTHSCDLCSTVGKLALLQHQTLKRACHD